jgi:hypothetical protein
MDRGVAMVYAVHMDSDSERSEPTRADLLCLDIDSRLGWLWAEAWEVARWTEELVGPFLRAAYGTGYLDALKERRPGELCRDHGLRVPGISSMPKDQS